MFTGIVQDLGTVVAVDQQDDGVRLRVSTSLAGDLAPGDSIAVNGCCLTAVGESSEVPAADGTSVLRNVYVINRGYEDLAERLNSVGAQIEIFRDI